MVTLSSRYSPLLSFSLFLIALTFLYPACVSVNMSGINQCFSVAGMFPGVLWQTHFSPIYRLALYLNCLDYSESTGTNSKPAEPTLTNSCWIVLWIQFPWVQSVYFLRIGRETEELFWFVACPLHTEKCPKYSGNGLLTKSNWPLLSKYHLLSDLLNELVNTDQFSGS